jgi:Domain of unknown function (DUF4184)
MPFTVSHLAAVLPAYKPLRRWGLLSAAIIGSMVPDFGFVFPEHLSRAQTHSALALVKFCLPTGLLAWALFQALVKPAWGAVLPDGWRLRLLADHPSARLGHWRVWPIAAGAVLVGAVSHLVWDGFTHEDGRGVRMLPFLEDSAPGIAGHVLPLYRWLQHGSSVLGLLVVLWAAWQWTRTAATSRGRATPGDRPLIALLSRRERYAWFAAYVLPPVCLLILGGAWHVHRHQGVFSITGELTRLAHLMMGGCVATLLAVSALIRARMAALLQSRLDA